MTEEKNMGLGQPPWIRQGITTRGLMLHLLFALSPALCAAGILFGPQALVLAAVTVAACMGTEALWLRFVKKNRSAPDLSAAVTGLLLALSLPADLPLWAAAAGGVAAVLLAKQFFGGLGKNLLNPAMAGRLVIAVFFARWLPAHPALLAAGGLAPLPGGQAALAQGAPLLQMLLGAHDGMMGETCAAALLLGGAWLLAQGILRPAAPAACLAVVAVLSFLTGRAPLEQLLTGGVLLGALFLLGDPVTTPCSLPGRLAYGMGTGALICAVRFLAPPADGVMTAVLLMNLLAPAAAGLAQWAGGRKKLPPDKMNKKTEGETEDVAGHDPV